MGLRFKIRFNAEIKVRTFVEQVCFVSSLFEATKLVRGVLMGSRGSSDAPQRQSPRAPLHLRATACSEANSVHHRPVAADRSPRVSPRGALQEVSEELPALVGHQFMH